MTEYVVGEGSSEPARHYWREYDGYERWRAWDPAEQKERYVSVHQLTAIAEGASPYKVFSNGLYETHHENRMKGDNRPENLTVLLNEEHACITFGHDDGRAEA